MATARRTIVATTPLGCVHRARQHTGDTCRACSPIVRSPDSPNPRMNHDVYLAIETSTQLGSVAVGHGRSVLAEVVLGIRVKQAEALLPAIDYALASAHIDKRDLARVIIGGGP